jgi:geranylgeranyl diphosphate synthase type II
VKQEQLKQFLHKNKQLIDDHLPNYIENLQAPVHLKESMIYSLKAGGKRLRPILLFATLKAFGVEPARGVDVACALEMIHTYSLIHDDLPSMDDDDLRRGMPTNHKVYGEATAILAGDGLLTLSFELISSIKDPHFSPEKKLQIIQLLASAAGPEGMVGGQMADIEAEGKSISLNELEDIHRNKTGRLLVFPVAAGAIIAGASNAQQENLIEFAKHLGLAFQIKDDILDVEGNEELLGKPVGSDENKQKSTYPHLLTLEGAKRKCEEELGLAKHFLHKASIDQDLLDEIAEYIVRRNH